MLCIPHHPRAEIRLQSKQLSKFLAEIDIEKPKAQMAKEIQIKKNTLLTCNLRLLIITYIPKRI